MNKKVVLGIVVENNNTLIVRRKKGEGDLQWQFPGGEMELGENEVETIERELLEETGLSCKAIKQIGERFHPYTKRDMSYWECRYLVGNISINDDDLDMAKWVPISDLEKYFTTDLFKRVKDFLDKKNNV